MTDPVLVQPTDRLPLSPQEVDDLISILEGEGLDAHPSAGGRVIPRGGALPDPWVQPVLIWLAAQTAGAVINLVVGDVVKWMRGLFRRDPSRRGPITVVFVVYEGDQGRSVEVIELRSARAKPVHRDVHPFERFTQTKPPQA